MKDEEFKKLEKRVKTLEERLNNYSFLINLSQELKIDKTIVNEVATYRSKARLYDALLSNTQNQIVISKDEATKLKEKTTFLEGLIQCMEVWVVREDIDVKKETETMLRAYKELNTALNRKW